MTNNDFKYVLQDITTLYIGTKYTYGELMKLDEIPFKLKTIFAHYMLKEVAEDTRPEDHIFYIRESDLSYMVYKQMKVSFRMKVWKDESDGRRTPGYVSGSYRIQEIVGNEELMRKKDQILVEEMQIKRLGLLSVSM